MELKIPCCPAAASCAGGNGSWREAFDRHTLGSVTSGKMAEARPKGLQIPRHFATLIRITIGARLPEFFPSNQHRSPVPTNAHITTIPSRQRVCGCSHFSLVRMTSIRLGNLLLGHFQVLQLPQTTDKRVIPNCQLHGRADVVVPGSSPSSLLPPYNPSLADLALIPCSITHSPSARRQGSSGASSKTQPSQSVCPLPSARLNQGVAIPFSSAGA